MRANRDFRPLQLYGVTQRGNQGQWVYRDEEDFRQAVALMARYSKMHDVRVHGWCLMHNHGHWILEASTEESISNFMRDMQGRYSFFLNRSIGWRLGCCWVPWRGALSGGRIRIIGGRVR
jgi:REP element-mobilizing transposase RayT